MEVSALAIGTAAWVTVLTRMAFDLFTTRPGLWSVSCRAADYC